MAARIGRGRFGGGGGDDRQGRKHRAAVIILGKELEKFKVGFGRATWPKGR